MAQQYDPLTWLIDRSHITDTISRMARGFDGDHQLLIDHVYTPHLHIDYDPLLGHKAETITVEEWTKRLTEIHKGYSHTQHIIQLVSTFLLGNAEIERGQCHIQINKWNSNLLIDLPPAGSSEKRPDKVAATAYAHGFFYNEDNTGLPRKMARRNGGSYKLEFSRIKQIEEQGGNPWRLSKLRVRLEWQDIGEC